MAVPVIPASVQLATIAWLWTAAIGDETTVPTGLTVTFDPAPEWLQYTAATPHMTIAPWSVTGTIDTTDGTLRGPDGTANVTLLPTDDTDLNPSAWTYQVTVRQDARVLMDFPIEAPGGVTTDLATVTPIAGSTGNAVVQGPPWVADGTSDGQVPTWDAATGKYVPSAQAAGGVTSVNSKTGNVTLVPSDIGAQPAGAYATAAQGTKADSAVQPAALAAYVPTARTVNGKPLSADITLVASDVGAQPAGSYATAAQGAKADTAVQPGSLATVATTGAYADLSGKPTIPIGIPDPAAVADRKVLTALSGAATWGSSSSAFELRGTGFPEGVVTASPGTYYTDTAGTNGAWRWLKTSGTGNTGWVVVVGDTGWRNVWADFTNATFDYGVILRRVGATCHLKGSFQPVSNALNTVYTLPAGFFGAPPQYSGGGAFVFQRDGDVHGAGFIDEQKFVKVKSVGTNSTSPAHRFSHTWLTSDPWPTTLPGVPA